MEAKGLQDKVNVVNFDAWCARQLDTYNVGKPHKGSDLNAYFQACIERVIRSADQKLIPSAQYDAVLIDEGHDFKPEWFKLVVQMIHPDTNSLLVLYDDAQSIYNGPRKLHFSFSSVGVQAKGRTTILKLNYRNTAEILSVARAFADDLLSPRDTEEDQAPTVQPMSTGRHGPRPLLIKLPTLKNEAEYLANRLTEANRTGMPWNEMAVVYRRFGIGQQLADALTRKGIPFQWPQDKKHSYSPMHDSVKLITMHSSKGLEFPLVCIPAISAPSKKKDDLQDEARLLYVAMTRATQELVMTHGEESFFGDKMQRAMGVLQAL
jgi:superfamily I DNA/RNA helicase